MSAAKQQISVTVSKDGPYIVSGDAPLSEQVIVANADGESLQWREGTLCHSGKIRAVSLRALTQSALLRRHPRKDRLRRQRNCRTHGLFGAGNRIRRTCSCPSGCEAPVRGRPVLRPEWQRMEPGRAHRRSANSRDVSPPSASLPCGSSRRLRQGRRSSHRGEFARLNRSDRRPGGRLQRADLAARGHLTNVGGRLSL